MMVAIFLILINTTGYEFMLVDPVAHRVGMGCAVFGDGFTAHYNPGGLGFTEDTYYSASYLNYIADTHFGYLGYEHNQIGVGIRYFNSGSIKKTDESGTELGSFAAHFIDINAGKGFIFKTVGLGVSIRGVYELIDTMYSIGAGLDFGALYIFPEQEIQIGLTIKNLGAGVKSFIEESELFPIEFCMGGVKRFPQGWFGMDIVKPSVQNLGWKIGGEYYITRYFVLRGAYNSLSTSMKTGSGLDFLVGLSVGIAVKKDRLSVDYSYSPYFDLGRGHRITIRIGG
jgi:hypothetical protein